MNCYIITGASRGLGESFAKQLLADGNALFCVSRSKNDALIRQADEKGIYLKYMQVDLNDLAAADGLMDEILTVLGPTAAARMALINNAGAVDPVKPAGRYPLDAVTASVHVNLAAPMLLTSAFIDRTARLSEDRRVLNISSGAARHPYFGWGAYCAAKAGLDMFTRCAGLEQRNQENPVKIIAVAPGVVDTAMQQKIRNTDEADFPNRPQFIEYHEKGFLTAPDAAAEKILRLFLDDEIETGKTYDIRELS